jgi:hypothetical protein
LRRILVLLVCFLVCVANATAQESRPPDADSVRTLYQALDYEAAERAAVAALDSDVVRTVSELAELHFMLGLIRYVRSDTLAARADFETVLSLDESYQPDPVLVSPRATSFFEQVRSDYRFTQPPGPEATRYLLVYDLRPGATLRSAILPGWGQWYRGDRTRGTVLGVAWVAAAGTAAALHILDEGDQDRSVARGAATAAAGVLWLYGYVDALLTPAYSSDARLRVMPVVTGDELGVSVAFRF